MLTTFSNYLPIIESNRTLSKPQLCNIIWNYRYYQWNIWVGLSVSSKIWKKITLLSISFRENACQDLSAPVFLPQSWNQLQLEHTRIYSPNYFIKMFCFFLLIYELIERIIFGLKIQYYVLTTYLCCRPEQRYYCT